jgi:cytochrome c oxidase subunit 2
MNKSKHTIAVILLTIVSTVGLFAFFNYVLYRLPTAASAEAEPIDTMIEIHFGLQAFLFALIMVIMLYAVFAFRRKPGDEEEGPHVHGHTGLEILWTIVPTAVVIVFGIYGATVLAGLLEAKPEERVVDVLGRQWSWQFAYPDIEDKTSAQLGLRVNEPVVLHMRSADVIHSFWVPEFRVKQDLLPVASDDEYYELRFTPTVEGTYAVRCAEICGLQHSQMIADVLVMNDADYEVWAAAIAAKPGLDELDGMTPEERGAFWYEQFGCNGCHSLDGTPGAGPTWQGLFGREEMLTDGTAVSVDDAYLINSILNPNSQIVQGYNAGIMPQNYLDQFSAYGYSDADGITSDLIAFIKTLSAEPAVSE